MPEKMGVPSMELRNEKRYKDRGDVYTYSLPDSVLESNLTKFAQELHKKMPWMVRTAGFIADGDKYVLEIPKQIAKNKVQELFDALNKEGGDFTLTDEVYAEDE